MDHFAKLTKLPRKKNRLFLEKLWLIECQKKAYRYFGIIVLI